MVSVVLGVVYTIVQLIAVRNSDKDMEGIRNENGTN